MGPWRAGRGSSAGDEGMCTVRRASPGAPGPTRRPSDRDRHQVARRAARLGRSASAHVAPDPSRRPTRRSTPRAGLALRVPRPNDSLKLTRARIAPTADTAPTPRPRSLAQALGRIPPTNRSVGGLPVVREHRGGARGDAQSWARRGRGGGPRAPAGMGRDRHQVARRGVRREPRGGPRGVPFRAPTTHCLRAP